MFVNRFLEGVNRFFGCVFISVFNKVVRVFHRVVNMVCSVFNWILFIELLICFVFHEVFKAVIKVFTVCICNKFFKVRVV